VKIAMIGQKGIPALYGGIERHGEEIARRLVLRGHEVSVYCRLHYTPTGGRYHGVELIRLPSINTKHLDTITHVALSTAHALTRDFDVLHFHALGPSLFAAPPRVLGRPTVVTVHGLDCSARSGGSSPNGRSSSARGRRCASPTARSSSRRPCASTSPRTSGATR
jgi:glycosyltransferase involved in cell wall biosynthesis